MHHAGVMSTRPDRAERDQPHVADPTERRGRRVTVSCLVFFFGDDDYEGQGSLVDLSTSGCRILSSEGLLPGTILRFSLFLKDHQWPVRIDQGLVRWAKEGTYGIEFVSIRAAQQERLRGVVMKRRS